MRLWPQNARSMSAAPILLSDEEISANKKGWGYVMAAVGAVLFAMKAIFIKLAYQPVDGMAVNELDTVTLLALRMAFALPVYIAIGYWAIKQRKSRGEDLPSIGLVLKAAGLGLIGYYICSYLDFTGLKYITAQLERLLLFTYPAFVFVLGALLFKTRIRLSGVISILIAYAGIFVIFMGGEIAIGLNVPLGSAMVLACAVLFALFQLLAKTQIDKIGSSLFTCTAMIAATTAIMAHFLVQNVGAGTLSTALNLPPRIYILGLAIAICSTILPSFLINIALGRIGAQAVAMFGMLSPLATIIVAIVWLGEPFGWLDACGTALTIFGIGLFTWFDRRAKSNRAG